MRVSELTSCEELELRQTLEIPAGSGHALVIDSREWSTFGQAEDPHEVQEEVDCDDDENEEPLHPFGLGDAVKSDGERGLARCRRDDAERRDDDGVEVDFLEVLIADGPDV